MSSINNSRKEGRNYIIPRDQRWLEFQKYVAHYEINQTFARRLFTGLDGYEIVFICDDSGSMNTPLDDIRKTHGRSETRWSRLQKTVSIVVDLASTLDPNGVDVYFLNRDPVLHVRNSKELVATFAEEPSGPTSVTKILRNILHMKRDEIQQRNLLIVLATDGLPTDDAGHTELAPFEHVLEKERIPINKIPMTIIACTNDREIMRYLNFLDKHVPYLDVVEDYKHEREQILRIQERGFPFTFGDYIVKTLMGGIDRWFDLLDEEKVVLDDSRYSKH
ncbi:unnamed protein product [Adineta ricciae]|uniref:VWFA domain-containing protein n=1 Tax=Adineta ricciae TaxID=249248 RepID=A0A813U0G4_ADIRI|nr:unnamed protein product [Adineta ricciae]